MSKLQIDQEFKKLIPPLSEEEYMQLEQNIITQSKCLNAIILWDGIVVDGHNRLKICVEHGIEFKVEEMTFDSSEDAKIWIIENQLGRRNLTDAMRIELALCKEEMLSQRAKEKQSQAGGDKSRAGALLSEVSTENKNSIHVRKNLANEAGVSEGNLYLYKQIKKHGNPALLEQVKKGELKIGTAYKMLAKEIKKKLNQTEKDYQYITEHMAFLDNEDAKTFINSRLAELATQLRTLLKKLEDTKGENNEAKN